MTEIIILAAGKGTRMSGELPKVLTPLNGRPMISYLLDSVAASNISSAPILVVSPDNKEIIQKHLVDYDLKYAVQTEQLGTGHAVASAKPKVAVDTQQIIVLYGDHPFIKPESINSLAAKTSEALSLMSVQLPDFSDWRQNFYHWGRLVRNEAGQLASIVEFKDASEDIRKVTEVNPAIFCLQADWLWKNIKDLQNNNIQAEYYLTDLVKIAFEQGHQIKTTAISPQEGMGINTPTELAVAKKTIFKNN